MPCSAARFSAILTLDLGIQETPPETLESEKPNMLDVREVVFSSCDPSQIIRLEQTILSSS